MTSNLKLLCNFVEKFLGSVHFGNDQFALILGYEDLVQGNITINRVYYVKGLNHNLFSVGQFCDADLEVAFWKSTCFVRDLQGNNLLTDKMKKKRIRAFWWDIPLSRRDIVFTTREQEFLVPQRQKASDYDNSDLVLQLQNVSPSAYTTVPSQQELDLLFGPLFDEFFNAGTSSVNKSSSPTDNSKQRDTSPTTNIQSTTEPRILITANAEENNDNQAEDEFTNRFYTPVREVVESSSRII
nr:integrase, catalytic region, zinc finger, CCHC-type, peptidase aspartic, catalytic [Tanacetum cinerariifolium]